MYYGGQGYLDDGYNGYMDGANDDSTIGRVRQHYWTAKQAVRSKLGKKEDDHLVASDAELDSKLAIFYSLKATSERLLRCIEHYQDYICEASQDGNALGRFLKQRGKADKTQAGKMMAAVGRAQSYTAQQRLALRVPLVRLHQELDVFCARAVSDCRQTVEATERARTEYRGSLLWMKNVSEQLDPDTYRQMERYRKVQAAVRRNKAKFDKTKLDCLQKVDLLAASRCNLFSQLMATYQNCLLAFWDRTSKAHSTVSHTFKGYQHYEFTILKDLSEPSRRLAEMTGGRVIEDDEEGTENGGGGDAAATKSDDSLLDLGADVEGAQAEPATDDGAATIHELLFDESPDEPTPTDSALLDIGGGGCAAPLGQPTKRFDDAPVPRLPPPPGWVPADGADSSHDAGGAAEPIKSDAELLDDLLLGNPIDTDTFAYQWMHRATVRSRAGGPDGRVAERDAEAAVDADDSPRHTGAPSAARGFMPSQLLESSAAPAVKNTKAANSAWFNLFAEIDPLQAIDKPDDNTM